VNAFLVGLKEDHINKSDRVTSITCMCIPQVLLEAIAANIGDKNLKSI
jgi:hypothetical protein